MQFKSLLILIISILAVLPATNVCAANFPSQGMRCPRLGGVQVYKGISFLCTTVNKKLVWKSKSSTPPFGSNVDLGSKAFALTSAVQLSNTEPCKLKNTLPNTTVSDGVASGFPLTSDLYRKTTIKALGFYVDFSDAQGLTEPISEINPYINKFNAFYDANSYGNLKFEWKLLPGYLRMPKPASYYRLNYASYKTSLNDTIVKFKEFLQDSVNLADPNVNFNDFDIVYIFTPSGVDKKLIDEIPPGFHTGMGGGIYSNEGPVRNTLGLTGAARENSGVGQVGLSNNNWRIFAHETGHILGFVDYYGPPIVETFVGQWDLMGLGYWNLAPELFAWDRWLQQWLPSKQVACVQNNTRSLIAISEVENTDSHFKMAVIPLGENTAIVMESRRKVGFDSDMPKSSEGLLVYKVDTSKQDHMGPIQVLSNHPNPMGITIWGGNMFKDAPLKQGESLEVAGYSISVLAAFPDGDIVQIQKKP
jgi:M6 family metalloprotease-like protein